MISYWQYFAQLADVGIRDKAPSIRQVFQQIVIAKTAVITGLDQYPEL